jgi:hypothetical protein
MDALEKQYFGGVHHWLPWVIIGLIAALGIYLVFFVVPKIIKYVFHVLILLVAIYLAVSRIDPIRKSVIEFLGSQYALPESCSL